MQYSVIVIDIPWMFEDLLDMDDVKRGAASQYPTLDTDELCKLDIKSLSDPKGTILAMWCVGSQMEEALKIMKAWGFKQKQVYVWVKVKKPKKNAQQHTIDDCLAFGMGRLFRQTHELCLIGTNNNGIYKKLQNKSQRSVSFGENKKHSAKPEHLQDSLDIMFPDPKIEKLEIFARRNRAGWTTIGNEVCAGEDVRDSIKRLQKM